MGKGRSYLDHLLERTSLEPESILFMPIVELAGDRRVLIENHRGVAAYGKEKVLVNVKFGSVCICGSDLAVLRMTKEQLVVCGRIDAINLLRRN